MEGARSSCCRPDRGQKKGAGGSGNLSGHGLHSEVDPRCSQREAELNQSRYLENRAREAGKGEEGDCSTPLGCAWKDPNVEGGFCGKVDLDLSFILDRSQSESQIQRGCLLPGCGESHHTSNGLEDRSGAPRGVVHAKTNRTKASPRDSSQAEQCTDGD